MKRNGSSVTTNTVEKVPVLWNETKEDGNETFRRDRTGFETLLKRKEERLKS